MCFNIPNTLSLIRLFLILIFVVVFYLPYSWATFGAALIFWVASMTDFLDGMIARRLKQTSRFGAFIDPVSDKVLVATALVLITDYYHSVWITIPAATIIAREIIISALREWMAEIGGKTHVAVSWVGKLKTVSQMVSLLILIWRYDNLTVHIGYFFIYLAMCLTYWSMFGYLRAAKTYYMHPEGQ